MTNKALVISLFLSFACVQAMGSVSNPDTSSNQPFATGSLHKDCALRMQTLLLNDALKYNYPGNLSQRLLIERVAFLYTFSDIILNEVNWPDDNSTTVNIIVSVEHFLNPNLPHSGWGPALNAGIKCNEYMSISMGSWNTNENVLLGLIWFSRALHFVEDLCMPSHGDPEWSFAGGDLATQWVRKEGHQSGEDAVCNRVNGWTEFDRYRTEGGIYEIADPHGGVLTPFSWVDRNAHSFASLRPYCDGFGGILGTDDDYDMVARATAHSFYGTAAGFANYYCEMISQGDTYCPVGLPEQPKPLNFTKVYGSDNELVFQWDPRPSSEVYRLWIRNIENDVLDMVDVGCPQTIDGKIQFSLNSSNGLPVDWAKYRFSATALYPNGQESDFSDWYAFWYPTNLVVTVENQSSVNLSWKDNSNEEDDFGIWYRRDTESYTTLPNMTVSPSPGNGATISQSIADLTPGGIYYFIVKSHTGSQYSLNDQEVRTCLQAPVTPIITTNIPRWEAVPDFTNWPCASIQLSHDQLMNTSFYEVERRVGTDDEWKSLLKTKSSWEMIYETRVFDTSILPNITFYYRVRAYNGCGYSDYSNETTVTANLGQPQNMQGVWTTSWGTSYLDLSWSNNCDIPGFCTILYGKKGNGQWQRISNVGSHYSVYEFDGPFQPLTDYYFKVEHCCNNWVSESSEPYVFTLPNTGYTTANNARRLFRDENNNLHAAFWNVAANDLVYEAHTNGDEHNWTVTNPGASNVTWSPQPGVLGRCPTSCGKIGGDYSYLVRALADSVVIDSIGPVPGQSRVIEIGSGRKFYPAVVNDQNGDLHVAWAETLITWEETYAGGHQYRARLDMRICYKKRSNGVWGSKLTLQPAEIHYSDWEYYSHPAPPNVDIFKPSLVVTSDAGAVIPHIVWSRNNIVDDFVFGYSYKHEIYYTMFDIGSNSFTTGTLISPASVDCSNPILAGKDNMPVVAWQQETNPSGYYVTGRDIYQTVKTTVGWTQPVNISNGNDGYSEQPTVAVADDGSIHILWQDNSQTGFIPKSTTYTSPAELKLVSTTQNTLPEVGEVVIWEDVDTISTKSVATKTPASTEITTTPNETQIFYRRYKNNSWSPIYRLTASLDPAIYPSLSLTDNAAQMGFIWTEGSGVKYKRLPDLDAPLVNASYPNGGELLLSGNECTFEWTEQDNRGVEIRKLYFADSKSLGETDSVWNWVEFASVNGTSDAFCWVVPNTIHSYNCRFKIEAYDSAGNMGQDSSDTDFVMVNPKKWYIEQGRYNPYASVSMDTIGLYGGSQLLLMSTALTEPGAWIQGPVLRKDIDDITITTDTRINWQQYDKDSSLIFELLVADVNGKEVWLIYGANASNHWDTDPGYVNMAVGQAIPGSSTGERVGRYHVWEKYSRNVTEDYLAEFGKVAATVKELRIGHYSNTGWAAGDHGGTIKSIVFSDAPRLAFTSGFEGTDYTSFADYPYENTIVPAFGGAVGADNGVVPHSGSKMYKIHGTDVNGPDLPKDAAKVVVPAIDGKTYWNLYDPFVKIGSGAYLSFWMYVYESPTNFGQIFIDATTKSGKRFSQVLSPANIYLCDTSGVRITPSIHKAPKGKWVNYVVNLTNTISYPTGLENEIINRLMLGYDDATNDQKGDFIAYVDDIQLLTSSPVYDRWMVAHYGGDANATIGWQEQTGGGAKLVMDNNGGEPVDWVMGPWVIKELSEPIAVSNDRVINWSQYDPIHALSFAVKITGKDGKSRWLCYSANGQNHAADPLGNEGLFGFVNMGITQETYNQWQTFNRNIYSDYLSLFGVEPSEITALGVSHFSYASWDGDNGGAVRDISFGREGQNWQTIATLLNPLATAYNNANRLAVSALGTLHLALSGIDEIIYTYSADQGRNWAAKQSIGQGQLPAIAVSSTGAPAAVWIQQWNATTPGFVLYSAQTNAGWSIPETLASIYIGPYDYIGGYSPPSITIKNDVVSIVYEYAYQIGIPPLIGRYWRLNQVRFPLSDPQNRLETVIDSTSWHPTDPWANPTSATLATDIKGNDHIAWHRDNKVFYRMRNVDGTYGAIVQLSGPDNAANPSISVSGVATVVWEENGEICMRQGLDQSWDPMVNISQTSAYSAMPTVLNNEVVWSEYITDYNADIFQSQYDITKMAYSYPSNLSQTENLSTYNHLATYKTLKYTKYYRLWTEAMTPYEMATDVISKTYYDVLFSIDSISNISRPLYALDAGQVNPSIFTLQRDGYIQYADEEKSDSSILPYKTVDYDSTALIYQFDNIDTTKIIDIVLSFYHELDGELKLKPMVDDIPLGEVKVPSKQEIVLEKRLPAACYRDGMLILRIEKNKGPIAVCGKILIYENPQGNGHGGAQSAEITSITPNYINKLYQNCPNPFSRKTNFMYQIKNQGQVTFKVYNALGQLVRTLVNESKPAGAYQVEWDGKDGCGLKVSSGVYIYRMQTGGFMETKKMVVIK